MQQSNVSPSQMQSKSITVIIFLLAVLVAIGVWFGYQRWSDRRAADKAVEAITDAFANVNVQVNNNAQYQAVEVKTDAGTIKTGQGTTLPADFPADVTVYPDAVVQAIANATTQAGDGVYLVLVTSDSVSQVDAYYAQRMVADGWKQQSSLSLAGVSSRTFVKGSRTGSVSATSRDGQTYVTLTVSAL
jgi:hypothetical protein